MLTSFLFFTSGCVEPPEYNDGLLENIPAIINEPDFFSFSLRAEDYTDSISYDLEFSSTNMNLLNTSLVVKDYSGQASDSTFIRLYNDNVATMLDFLVNTNITAFSEDSVPHVIDLEYLPDYIILSLESCYFDNEGECSLKENNRIHHVIK